MKISAFIHGMLVICISVFSVTSNSAAQPFGGPGSRMGRGAGHGGMGHGPGWALRQLDLSPEQQEQLSCETPGQGRELKDALAVERSKLNDMIRDKNIPDDQIHIQLDTVNQKLADWSRFRLEKMLKVRKVLSEAQMQKLLELQRESVED